MSSPTDRIRAIADAVDIAGVHPSLKILADAARSFVDGEPIEWCETHRAPVTHDDQGVDPDCVRFEWEPSDLAEAPELESSCSIVTRWLSEPPAVHLLPGDKDEGEE